LYIYSKNKCSVFQKLQMTLMHVGRILQNLFLFL
jgi:hypothetical protein